MGIEDREPFRIREVAPHTGPRAALTSAPPLGPLTSFTGTFAGTGLNTIFRPDNLASQTPMPNPVIPATQPRDNVLEINLTSETLTFSPSLGSVPNRGELQKDIFLNGVPYLQKISDITVPTQPVGIHFEPGLWMAVPETQDPDINTPTLVRMASIPHGTTIEAQGTSPDPIPGKPTIPPRSITPFEMGTTTLVRFQSQTVTDPNTPRIPQDLSPFVQAGTITQAILDNPNLILSNHIANQDIISTTTIIVATNPQAPLFGGGTANIAFLLGTPSASAPNADAVSMNAVFWIETVQCQIELPIWYPGQPPLIIPAPTGEAGQPIPKFKVTPSRPIIDPEKINVTYTQIQYSQLVLLNFNTLSWPHVSVATLVPQDPIPVSV